MIPKIDGKKMSTSSEWVILCLALLNSSKVMPWGGIPACLLFSMLTVFSQAGSSTHLLTSAQEFLITPFPVLSVSICVFTLSVLARCSFANLGRRFVLKGTIGLLNDSLSRITIPAALNLDLIFEFPPNKMNLMSFLQVPQCNRLSKGGLGLQPPI